jgi:Tfp pilus assembly protein PilX
MKLQSNARGVALIVGLIFLIILTLFVLGGLRDVLLQERMAGSYRNQSLAENAAQSLLRDAEARIFAHVVSTGGQIDVPGMAALDADQAVAPSNNVREFRTGVGYPASAALAIQSPAQGASGSVYSTSLIATSDLSFQNRPTINSVVQEENDLSQAGAYVIEGPIYTSKSDLPAFLESQSGNLASGGAKGQLYSFRITVRATGGTDDFVKALESFYIVSK